LGLKVESFALELNLPTDIAFRAIARAFGGFVTEARTRLPGRCNSAEGFARATELPDIENPFLPQVRVVDQHGKTGRVLGCSPRVDRREEVAFLHAPTNGKEPDNGL
jgi:hypothetical protein